MQLQINRTLSASLLQILASGGVVSQNAQPGAAGSGAGAGVGAAALIGIFGDASGEGEGGKTGEHAASKRGSGDGPAHGPGHRFGKILRNLAQNLRNFNTGLLFEELAQRAGDTARNIPAELTQPKTAQLNQNVTTLMLAMSKGAVPRAPAGSTTPVTGTSQPATGVGVTATASGGQIEATRELVRSFEAYRATDGTASLLSLSSTIKADFVLKTQRFAMNLLNAPTIELARSSSPTAGAETARATAQNPAGTNPGALVKFARRAELLAQRLEHLQAHAAPQSIKLNREITQLLRHASKLIGEAQPLSSPAKGVAQAALYTNGAATHGAVLAPGPQTALPTVQVLARYGFSFDLEFKSTQALAAELTQINDDGVTLRRVTAEKSLTQIVRFTIEGSLGTAPTTVGAAAQTVGIQPIPAPAGAVAAGEPGIGGEGMAATKADADEIKPLRPELVAAQLLNGRGATQPDGIRIDLADNARDAQQPLQQQPAQSDPQGFRYAEYLAHVQNFQSQTLQEHELLSAAFKVAGEGFAVNALQLEYQPIEVIAPVFEIMQGPHDGDAGAEDAEIVEVEAEIS